MPSKDPDSNLWEDVGFIRASKYRGPILEALADEQPLTPSEIAEKADIDIRTVSMYICGENGLDKQGLVECLNKSAKKGRLYRLTNRGGEVLELIKENGDFRE